MLDLIEDRSKLDYFRSNAQAEASNYTFVKYRANLLQFLYDVDGFVGGCNGSEAEDG